MRKPKTIPQRFGLIFVTVGVYALLSVLFVIAIIPILIYIFGVAIPIIHAVQTEPLYWLTWKEVKRKSGKSTGSVLRALHLWSSGDSSIFDCQWRDEAEVLQLERHLRRSRPKQDYPLSSRQAVFFRYRRRGGGPPKRSRTHWSSIVGWWMPKPVRV